VKLEVEEKEAHVLLIDVVAGEKKDLTIGLVLDLKEETIDRILQIQEETIGLVLDLKEEMIDRILQIQEEMIGLVLDLKEEMIGLVQDLKRAVGQVIKN
jgi:hypothetical protein